VRRGGEVAAAWQVMALLVEQGARLQRVEAALAAGPAPAFALHHLAPRP
jgi:hypothetical protein